MEAIHERPINGGYFQDVKGNLNKRYENNSVQMAGQDNEVTYVQGDQINAGGDTINNSGGGQVMIIKQYFPLDYLGPGRNTIHRRSLPNDRMYLMYPTAPPPDRSGHMLPHSPGDTTCQCASTRCPHFGHPRICPHQFNNHPLLYPSDYLTYIQCPRSDSIGSFFPPPLPVPILTPVPLRIPILIPIPTLAPVQVQLSTLHGVNAAANPAYPPYTLFRSLSGGPLDGTQYRLVLSPSHRLPDDSHTRVPLPWTAIPPVGLGAILHSSTSDVLSPIPLDPRRPSTISQHDHVSGPYQPNLFTYITPGLVPVAVRLQEALEDQQTNVPTPRLQEAEPEAQPLHESVSISSPNLELSQTRTSA